MPAPLLIERTGAIETWTLDLPELRNPITSTEMIEAVVSNLERADADLDLKCIILTGAGPGFSSGGDVNAMVERRGMFAGSPYELRQGYRHGVQRIPLAFHHCEVPVVAAVNGAAVGAGCDLAMMADIRIASERAFFAESFVQLGIIPGDGGAWLLTTAIGPARAAEMALTGDRVDAAKALEWGLVTKVSAHDELMTDAMELAERIAKNPAPSLRMAKKLLRESRTRDLADVLELSASMQALAHHTEEHREFCESVLERKRQKEQ